MSFLLSDQEQFATLGEVLTFIDASDFDETSTTFETTDGELLLHNIREGGESPTDVRLSHKKFKSKKRKRRNLSSSTRLQQCKKAKILYLRKRVLELEDRMHHLQSTPKYPRFLLPGRSSVVKTEVKSMWEELAEDHYQARLQSEEQNRALKAIVAKQVQLGEMLCAIVQEQAVFQEMDLACIQPSTDSNDFVPQVSRLGEFSGFYIQSCNEGLNPPVSYTLSNSVQL